MSEKLVSVIIPTYNRAAAVCSAVQSVLNQTYANMEVVVVDDGSSDDTLERLSVYTRDDRVRVIRQENAGPSAARNHGIRVSHGELLAFLDSDDLWEPGKLEKQVAVLQRTDETVVCCLCNAVVRDGEKQRHSFDLAPIAPHYDCGLWTNVTEVLSTRCIFFTQAVMVRREAMERIGGFDEELRILEDHDLALRLSLEGPWAYVCEPLVLYNNTPDSLSSQAHEQKERLYRALETVNAKMVQNEKLQDARIRKNFAGNLESAKRYMRFSDAVHRGVCGAGVFESSMLKARRFTRALRRRSPWYPKMQDRPLD